MDCLITFSLHDASINRITRKQQSSPTSWYINMLSFMRWFTALKMDWAHVLHTTGCDHTFKHLHYVVHQCTQMTIATLPKTLIQLASITHSHDLPQQQPQYSI
jgi:hypothetical protein